MTSPGTIIYRLSLVVMVASAAVIALWLAALKDYSYAVLAAPASFVGMASWAVAGIVEAGGGGPELPSGDSLPEVPEGGLGAAECLEELLFARPLGTRLGFERPAHLGHLLDRFAAEFPLSVLAPLEGDAESLLLNDDNLFLGGNLGGGNQRHPEVVEDFTEMDSGKVQSGDVFGKQAGVQAVDSLLDQFRLVVEPLDAEIESFEQAARGILAQQRVRLGRDGGSGGRSGTLGCDQRGRGSCWRGWRLGKSR